jgi:hypothetical protein
LTLQVAGWSKVSWPSAVVKLLHAADAGAVAVGELVAVGMAVVVSVAVAVVTVGLGLDVVVGPACGPQPVNSKAIRMAVGKTAPDAAGLRITPSFGSG